MDNERQKRWDHDYLALAAFWAKLKSKDPSTQVGAVIVSTENNVIGMGYNGFPKGVRDRPERYNVRSEKYKFVVHAEPNAILSAAGHALKDSTIYTWPFPTCSNCAKLIIQAGIKRVVAPNLDIERWGDEIMTARTMYKEAGVELELYDVRTNDETPDGQGVEGTGCGCG